jgi:hypothetical protein
MFPSGYSNHSHNRRQTTTDASSTRSREPNFSRQQAQQATYSGHASTNTYQEELDSELAHLLMPCSPPRSLDHMLSAPTQPRNLYENIERQLHAEPSSSSSKHPETNPDFQRIYNEFSQLATSTAPSSKSEHQSMAIAQSSSQTPISHYPGVRYMPNSSRWVAGYSTEGKRVWVGSFKTEEEAKKALDESRASRGLPPVGSDSKQQCHSSKSRQQSTAGMPPSSQAPKSQHSLVRYRPHFSSWVVEYKDSTQKGGRVWVGSFKTEDEAKKALDESRASRGLPPTGRTSKRQPNPI